LKSAQMLAKDSTRILLRIRERRIRHPLRALFGKFIESAQTLVRQAEDSARIPLEI
jgi:hypothetical protein